MESLLVLQVGTSNLYYKVSLLLTLQILVMTNQVQNMILGNGRYYQYCIKENRFAGLNGNFNKVEIPKVDQIFQVKSTLEIRNLIPMLI